MPCFLFLFVTFWKPWMSRFRIETWLKTLHVLSTLKWMWLLNVNFKVSAGTRSALRDGLFLFVPCCSQSQHLNDQKSVISHRLLNFLCNSPKTFLPLSLLCLPAGWILSCSVCHRGEGLELAKDLGWVDRWREGIRNSRELDFISWG